ncbi:hypothetical protein EJ05DRAFT_196368 [Pseudovirgaria hyperparasitica]|uniref:Uncharacterized protein n=1 Tax=Pseudovirgaria hyperparasitica TaxID=470096 RepID=A0A6A6WIU6_9PEZI|nr:uncharacterized protein EJ05DRAFT_196368 [Pseudovirgaria hyperparasitica]KAF2762085.1 hypothetical protein EJ05DRAFT_196368 [Pseudovirgaria hyperparasitica]
MTTPRLLTQFRPKTSPIRIPFRRITTLLSTRPRPRLQTTSTPTALTRPLLTSPHPRTMASDEAYAAFLDKANQDTSPAQTQSPAKPSTKSVDTAIPAALQNIEQYYQSDADEPFEPVSLSYETADLPSDDGLAQLIGHKDGVEGLSRQDFDPRGRYEGVFEAVREAAGGQEVRVYRVRLGGTRVEYYVVGVDGGNGRLVGLKALAVES